MGQDDAGEPPGTVRRVTIRRVVAAPDKFKGTLTAREVAAAIGHACWERGLDCVEIPLADGGDGLVEALGGANRHSTVTGPLGDPVVAPWRFARDTAVIEMASASGLTVAGGADANDPIAATTSGTGELIEHALDAGARRIVVGLGGSATTDGGFGAVRSIGGIARLRSVELIAACDVTTTFLDAAAVYGPQKGATEAQVRLLRRRLDRLVQMYREEFQIDVTTVVGGGAAGGLGGALAALGATLMPGVELVAEELGFDEQLVDADLVITGEGRIDATSFAGKVVGGVCEMAAGADVPVAAVAGSLGVERDEVVAPGRLEAVATLVDACGQERAFSEPRHCVEAAAGGLLASLVERG